MKLKIFSGQSNLPLAQGIARYLNLPLGEIYHHSFPSGESYCQYKENIRGCDVFLIQGITNPANENLMQLLIMADAARRASAERITAVIPYFGYSRQDRKDKSRVPISAKLILDLIQAAGINRVVTMDLHSPQVGGFTNLPFDHLTFEPVLTNYIRNKYQNLALRDSVVVMAPDVGAVKRAEKYAATLNTDFGFISKKRIDDENVDFQSIVGDVTNKHVIIVDDMTESCGTLTQAAAACKFNGALDVTCAITHCGITPKGECRLDNVMNSIRPNVDCLIHSNTIDFQWSTEVNKPKNIIPLDVSEIFGKAIYNIHNNESVSELFE